MKFCNLCGFPLVRINSSVFGLRCIRCRFTFIHRALGEVLNDLKFHRDLRVHEFSCHGAIYHYLRRHFKNLSVSEYFDDVDLGSFKDGVQCQDIQQLTFDSDSFDLMTSTEVFEHVPDDKKGFSEVLRCLKPHGYFIFTVPIVEVRETVQRARISDQQIIHILEPEYHGDHIRNQGILAFRNYGLDLKDLLLEVGFKNVELRLIENAGKGIFPAKRVVIAQK